VDAALQPDRDHRTIDLAAPYIAIGTSGKFNHMVGVRSAGMVLAINPDQHTPVWEHADVGIVADWRDCINLLEEELRRVTGPRPMPVEA
jgi:electron transfer flavoprotein alpha subunit